MHIGTRTTNINESTKKSKFKSLDRFTESYAPHVLLPTTTSTKEAVVDTINSNRSTIIEAPTSNRQRSQSIVSRIKIDGTIIENMRSSQLSSRYDAKHTNIQQHHTSVSSALSTAISSSNLNHNNHLHQHHLHNNNNNSSNSHRMDYIDPLNRYDVSKPRNDSNRYYGYTLAPSVNIDNFPFSRHVKQSNQNSGRSFRRLDNGYERGNTDGCMSPLNSVGRNGGKIDTGKLNRSNTEDQKLCHNALHGRSRNVSHRNSMASVSVYSKRRNNVKSATCGAIPSAEGSAVAASDVESSKETKKSRQSTGEFYDLAGYNSRIACKLNVKSRKTGFRGCLKTCAPSLSSASSSRDTLFSCSEGSLSSNGGDVLSSARRTEWQQNFHGRYNKNKSVYGVENNRRPQYRLSDKDEKTYYNHLTGYDAYAKIFDNNKTLRSSHYYDISSSRAPTLPSHVCRRESPLLDYQRRNKRSNELWKSSRYLAKAETNRTPSPPTPESGKLGNLIQSFVLSSPLQMKRRPLMGEIKVFSNKMNQSQQNVYTRNQPPKLEQQDSSLSNQAEYTFSRNFQPGRHLTSRCYSGSSSTTAATTHQSRSPKSPIYLRVYDISEGQAEKWSKLFLSSPIEGIWHTGIYVYGYEYFYCNGVLRMVPNDVESTFAMILRNVHYVGNTSRSRKSFERFLEMLSPHFSEETYDIFGWNCNDFTNVCALWLLRKAKCNLLPYSSLYSQRVKGGTEKDTLEIRSQRLKNLFGAYSRIENFRAIPSYLLNQEERLMNSTVGRIVLAFLRAAQNNSIIAKLDEGIFPNRVTSFCENVASRFRQNFDSAFQVVPSENTDKASPWCWC